MQCVCVQCHPPPGKIPSSTVKYSMQLLMIIIMLLLSLLVVSVLQKATLALKPSSDITRFEGEIDVFIPCPFEFQPTPSLWIINKTSYSSATLPSLFTLNPGGLLIKIIHRCLDQTSFQCIDTSSNSLAGQKGSVVILTVLSRETCTESESEDFLNVGRGSIDLDHQRISYGKNTTTIAWRDEASCSVSWIQSHLPCHQNEININITTNMSKVTVMSDTLQESGELFDFNISHLSEDCTHSSDTFRFNVSETEIVNLILGNNNCSCIELECRGALNVAISNPGVSPMPDVICPIFADTCYSPAACNRFDETPFFLICDDQSENLVTDCTYSLCLENATEELNGTRLDFFVLNKTRCNSGLVYYPREYYRSFELIVDRASARIIINTTSEEVCFMTSSPLDCDVVQLTQYNVTINDITGNLVFKDEQIPENTCVPLGDLSPQCGPHRVSAQPYNEHLLYTPVSQEIISDSMIADLCPCLKDKIHLQVDVNTHRVEDNLLIYDVICSTMYLTQVYLSVVLSSNTKNDSKKITCPSRQTVSITLEPDNCNTLITTCGYWVLMNGSTYLDCPLNCTSIISTQECTNTKPTSRSPGTTAVIAIIAAVILVAMIITVMIVVIMVLRIMRKRALNVHPPNRSTSGVALNEKFESDDNEESSKF